MKESTIQRQIRYAVNQDGRARLVRNACGRDERANVRYGLGLGSADLVGILIGTGRAVALEIKTAVGKLRPDQVTWLAAFRSLGGFAAVARSVPEAIAAIDRAVQGDSE